MIELNDDSNKFVTLTQKQLSDDLYLGVALDVGSQLAVLYFDQSEWSQATFGTDAERGPIGALKHLKKEAKEAEDAADHLRVNSIPWQADHTTSDAAVEEAQQELIVSSKKQLQEELADCLLLLLDANRRAGFSVLDLILAAQAKMKVNRTRTYPRPTSDVPSEHVKGKAA